MAKQKALLYRRVAKIQQNSTAKQTPRGRIDGFPLTVSKKVVELTYGPKRINGARRADLRECAGLTEGICNNTKHP